MKTKFKVGDYVYVNNPFWNLYARKEKIYIRKIKAIYGDDVFFNNGSNSQIKFIYKK